MRCLLLILGVAFSPTIAFTETAGEQADSKQLATREEMIDALAAWAARVSSFDGAFEITQLDFRAEAQDPKAVRSYRFKSDFEGSRWMQVRMLSGSLLTESLVDGLYSHRLDREHPDHPEIKGEVILNSPKGWPFPPGTEMFPDDFLRKTRNGILFSEALREGAFFVAEHQGEAYLACEHNGKAFNCFFYPNGDVWRIQTCLRFGKTPEKRSVLAQALGMDANDLYEVFDDYDFMNYIELDGVKFPAVVREVDYENLAAESAQNALSNKQIDYAEYVRRVLEGARAGRVRSQREFVLDISSTRLNVALAPAAFAIEYGIGDLVAQAGDKIATFQLPWHKRFFAWLLKTGGAISPRFLLVAGSALCLVIAGVLIYRRKQRHTAT